MHATRRESWLALPQGGFDAPASGLADWPETAAAAGNGVAIGTEPLAALPGVAAAGRSGVERGGAGRMIATLLLIGARRAGRAGPRERERKAEPATVVTRTLPAPPPPRGWRRAGRAAGRRDSWLVCGWEGVCVVLTGINPNGGAARPPRHPRRPSPPGAARAAPPRHAPPAPADEVRGPGSSNEIVGRCWKF